MGTCWPFKHIVIIVFLAISVSFQTANSDPQTKFLIRGCSPYNATNVRDFFNNLNASFADLRNQISQEKKHFAATEHPVYALFQCRNYLFNDDCLSCYNIAVSQIRYCSAATGARVLFDGCFLRYESAMFYSETTPQDGYGEICSSTNASQPTNFQTQAGDLLQDLKLATPRMNGFFAASKRQLSSDGSSNNTKAIIGGVVGGVGLALLIWYQQNRKPNKVQKVLEIISGIGCNTKVEPHSGYLLEQACKLYEVDVHLQLVDETLDPNDYDAEEVKKVIDIAMVCTQSQPSKRPTMSEVVVLLSSDMSIEQRRLSSNNSMIGIDRKFYKDTLIPETFVQGAGSKEFHRAFSDTISQYKPDVMAVLEPRIGGKRADDVVKISGFDRSFRIEAQGFAGGIWILWRDRVDVEIFKCHKQFLHTALKCGEERFFMTFVYASPNVQRRRSLWHELESLAASVHGPWLLGGDFNSLLRSSEKQGGSQRVQCVNVGFAEWFFNNNMCEPCTDGSKFTWFRPDGLSEKLDRFIANTEWMDQYQEARVHHLPRLRSDHVPIMMRCKKFSPQLHGSKGFRFLVPWLLRDGFRKLVDESWVEGVTFEEAILSFASKAKEWNHNVFGNIFQRKKKLRARLEGAQRNLQYYQTERLVQLERSLREELEEVLLQEELLMIQKSQRDWSLFGDRNTAFYHRKGMDENFVFPKGSVVLRAISRVWCHVVKGIRWSVGDGKSIRFWWDNWLHTSEPLINSATAVVPAEQINLTLDCFVIELGQWNWQYFQHLLPATCLLRIAAIMPPRLQAGSDVSYWGFSGDGNFSTSSAYASLTPTEVERNNKLWRVIWSWTGPQRVRQFLWLVAKEAILTNSQRWNRRIADSPACDLCGGALESTMHALRDCPKAANIWSRMVPAKHKGRFFGSSLEDWLWNNLTNAFGMEVANWECTFGVTAWQIWAQRNAFIFANTPCNASRKIDDVHRHIQSVLSAVAWERSLGGVDLLVDQGLHAAADGLAGIVASTSFQDWYIVKRRLRSGVKKMVEAYSGSPEWKPDFLFVRAPKNYCLLWNHRETEGLGAIKDEWTQVDDECIEELDADVKKILEYTKVMSSSNAGSLLFGDEDPFTIVNSDEDVSVTAALGQKKKKKRVVKAGDKVKYKKARTDAPPKETVVPVEETVPPATETVKNPLPETGPSVAPPGSEKGKGLIEGEAIILPPNCSKEISAAWMAYLVQLRKLREDLVTARSERDEALFEVVTLEEKARQVRAKEAEIASVQAKYDELDEKMKSFASLHISKEELHQWCAAFMYKMLYTGGMAVTLEEMNLVATKCGAHREALSGALAKMSSPADIASFPGDVPAILAKGPSEEDSIPDVPDEYMGIELEDADEATEEDVADTGHSGVQRNAEDASQNPSKDHPPGSDAI
ncbi:OLC1v1015718C1 [Oldenlandia corymbosa var. corymbosa]|uniref:OLC1v1015718C1 n=1 Tax=Oldenlandia corymbosa var. corymbosa TaxID=529605 RepID=A0AAV1E461_OLDCO|nr:OLC1v1015718C1 [Oldenlandia corymbosa var. corymbosa]